MYVLGLNETEIQLAFKQAGLTETESPKEKLNLATSENIIETKNVETKVKTSIWSRIFKWIKNLLLAGCFAYTAYKILIRVSGNF